jgi:uncharacterized protein (TIGR00369 family)
MSVFAPVDDGFEERVRASFERQGVMELMGARLTRVDAGIVEITAPFRKDLTQQHGFFHAGVATTLADSAAGYAAYTLLPADAAILAVELKINFLAPARGEELIATGRVLKPGRTLTVNEMDVHCLDGGARVLCARGIQTTMCLRDRTSLTPG